MNFVIITRCTRPDNLKAIKSSIYPFTLDYKIKWVVMFDISQVGQLNRSEITSLADEWVEAKFIQGIPGDMAYSNINDLLQSYSTLTDAWAYILDDDTILHPDFKSIFDTALSTEKNIIVFDQYVGGKDWSGVEVRKASLQNLKVQRIDVGQYITRCSVAHTVKYNGQDYCADGHYIEEFAKKHLDSFYFVNKQCSYYNTITNQSSKGLPRVVCLDQDISKLKYTSPFPYESTELEIIKLDEKQLLKNFQEWDPDAIVSTEGNWESKKYMCQSSSNIRGRWLHKPDGRGTYECANSFILNSDEQLISVFTPTYKTGKKLMRTYNSLLYQTYQNWEWVIVRDSTDKETDDAIDYCKKDPRVKVYTVSPLSRGRIGESKYRAAMLTTGEYLVELDHDDQLHHDALQHIYDAFRAYPDAGFAYTGCVELDNKLKTHTYEPGFAFGYGAYRKEKHFGVEMDCCISNNINPATIRHIVGVPNHARVWRRNIYFQTGGYNRRLTIADDYELIVRTFLITKFVKIDRTLYFQYIHESNTTDKRRADIQRRVRSIARKYNDRINKRFTELGKVDWAYVPGGDTPSNTIQFRYGDREEYTNYIYI